MLLVWRLKRIIWWKVICSKGNQFGRHYVWSWNANVDTDSVFEKVLESIKYFTNVFDHMPDKDKS